MLDAREDQAAGLRRLFRRAPPAVVAMYATGRYRQASAVQTIYRLAGQSERLLILDEANGAEALNRIFALPDGVDLLGVLGPGVNASHLLQPIPGLVGRVPVSAAALALPLLDHARRGHLVSALGHIFRRVGFVLIYTEVDNASDPSPFVSAAPRRLVVAEASRSGATQAYQVIKQLSAAGAGSLHVAVARASSRTDAQAFFGTLNDLVRRHIGVPLAYLGEVERDDLAAGLASDAADASLRGAENAFLRRLESLSWTAARPRRSARR